MITVAFIVEFVSWFEQNNAEGAKDVEQVEENHLSCVMLSYNHDLILLQLNWNTLRSLAAAAVW